jgi:glycerol kinase
MLLAIDQGTTSSRAVLFRDDLTVAAVRQQEFPQIFPQSGFVEHEPEAIWTSVLEVCRAVIADTGTKLSAIAAIGITNQRETTLIWDRKSGKPIHRAIVWQDRRTAERCQNLREQGKEPLVTQKTGLLLDPYFSATKIGAILDAVPGARDRAEKGELAFGTVDSFLIWRLTGGKVHATDATNASRTSLYNLHTGDWDDELLALFDVPRALLPEIRDCAASYGTTHPDLLGASLPILGVAGDQHAATIGQACFKPGMMKATYGTGCFALMNTGSRLIPSNHRLLTTLAYQLNGERTYALEGSIFVAGAAIQWLRDGLGLIKSAKEADAMAARANPAERVYLVPAFVGLGAPYWDPDARGAMFGLTRNTGADELVRAALEAVCYQSRDLVDAMRSDWPLTSAEALVLRVDGGMAASNWTMQRLADLLPATVDRPAMTETTALGAAWLAGHAARICPTAEEFGAMWQAERRFLPCQKAEEREADLAGWKDAVARTLRLRA